MISVFIEVGNGPARFTVPVRAESLLAAVGAAKERYPDVDPRVIFPISPEEFFVKDDAAEIIETGALEVTK